LARAVVAGLAVTGRHAIVLDDDRVAAADDRSGPAIVGGHVACAADLAMGLVAEGMVAIVVAASPRVRDRERARIEHERRRIPFVEVHVDTPADVCAARGHADPGYEPPPLPDLVVRPGPLLPAVLSIVDLL
jgi:adenylylsulfate kinase-like enzyme